MPYSKSASFKMRFFPLLLLVIMGTFFLEGCRFLNISDDVGPELSGLPVPIEGISFSRDRFKAIEIEYDTTIYSAEDIISLRYYFASRVVYFLQAPGQFVNAGDFGMAFAARNALGPPVGGGTYAANNSSLVSLGMGGGEIILEFDEPIKNRDDPEHPGGYDFIVFGNAFWSQGQPDEHWQEPGVVWVGVDEQGTGNFLEANWYVILGSAMQETHVMHEQIYDAYNSEFKPYNKGWYPDREIYEDYPEQMILNFFKLDQKYGGNSPHEIWGYCDVTPTLILGDMSGAGQRLKYGSIPNSLNEPEDNIDMKPWDFYTIPNDHDISQGNLGVDPGSGGGDAIDIDWARDPDELGTPIHLEEITWVRIVNGMVKQDGTFGEISTEVDAVARVKGTDE